MFIDLKKASDTMKHMLQRKYHRYAMCGTASKWINSNLNNKKRVKINVINSKLINVVSDISIVLNFGLTLLIVYINEIYMFSDSLKFIFIGDKAYLILVLIPIF